MRSGCPRLLWCAILPASPVESGAAAAAGATEFTRLTRYGGELAREVWTGIPTLGPREDQLAAAQAAGYEPDGEYLIGRDPREMTQAELAANATS